MSDLERSPEIRPLRLPGTKRLRLLRVYFGLSGGLAAYVAVMLSLTGWLGSERWVLIPSLALGAFGCLRAERLLRQRRKAGAQLAAVCLAISLAIAVHAQHARGFSWSTLAIPLLGLGLLASVWDYLE